MSAPDPESAGIGAQLLQWAWAGVLLLVGLVYKAVTTDIEKKASKETVEALIKAMEQSKVIEAKLYDELASVRADMNRNHITLLNAIHEKNGQ